MSRWVVEIRDAASTGIPAYSAIFNKAGRDGRKSLSKILEWKYMDGIRDQGWLQIGSHWPQMKQIRDFFRSDFSNSCAKMYWNFFLKKIRIWANLTHLGPKSVNPAPPRQCMCVVLMTYWTLLEQMLKTSKCVASSSYQRFWKYMVLYTHFFFTASLVVFRVIS